MNAQTMEEILPKLLEFLTEDGYKKKYFHEKGGDSSCVYVLRFQKGRDYFDWREVSGADEVHTIAYVNGEYRFPNLKKLYPKEYRKFAFKHLLKRTSIQERRTFVAEILKREFSSSKPDFFGIPETVK